MAASALLAVVAVATAGCAREVDGDPVDRLVDRQEYVDAFTTTAVEDEDFLFSDDEASCMADAIVAVVGLEVLVDKVTPEEVRDNPDDYLDDWGIELDEAQAHAMYEGFARCANLPAAVVSIFGEMPGTTPGVHDACLEQSLDDTLVEDLMVTGLLSDSDDFELSEDQAQAMYDWLNGCVDMEQVMLSFGSEEEVPPELLDCIGTRLDDAAVERFWIMALTGSEDEDMADEITAAMEACALDLGIVPGQES